MRHLTITNGGWLRNTTATGLIPLLLVQVLVALFCVPETLTAGTEIRREMTWEELPAFLEGEKKVTVILAEGGAVRSGRVTILSDSIHLGHVTKATNWKRYPWGSESSIPRDSVWEILVEKMKGNNRVWGAIAGGTGGFGLALLTTIVTDDLTVANLATLLSAPCAGVVLGHWVGERSDRVTTIITIVD